MNQKQAYLKYIKNMIRENINEINNNNKEEIADNIYKKIKIFID